jgi:hypothetical protein
MGSISTCRSPIQDGLGAVTHCERVRARGIDTCGRALTAAARIERKQARVLPSGS